MPGCCPRPAPPECWALPAAEPGPYAHTSEASKLPSETAGANFISHAMVKCANGGKARKEQGLGRTSAFAPRSPICAAPPSTVRAQHASAHDRKLPHQDPLLSLPSDREERVEQLILTSNARQHRA